MFKEFWIFKLNEEKMIGSKAKKILLIFTSIVFLSILIFLFLVIYELSDIIEDPDKILSQYKLGSDMKSLQINEKEILFQLKTDDKIWNINIIIRGYEHPDKYLEKNQELILIGKGEYILYLYFDEKGILIDKEIVGS